MKISVLLGFYLTAIPEEFIETNFSIFDLECDFTIMISQ